MSQRKKPAEMTLIELAVANVGLVRAGKALGVLATWCVALHKLGPDMDVYGYQEFWLMSRAQAFREQALIRKAFPGVEPVKVHGFVMTEYRRRMGEWDRKQAAKLGGDMVSIPASAVLA